MPFLTQKIVRFGTFFTHFEMILLYPEPYLSYFWCRIKRNRTNIMKTTIKYICTGLSLCACTCLVNNLPAQAETTNTAAVSATETGWDRQSIMGSCPAGGGLADQRLSRKQICQERTARMDRRSTLYGDVRLGGTEWRQYLL